MTRLGSKIGASLRKSRGEKVAKKSIGRVDTEFLPLLGAPESGGLQMIDLEKFQWNQPLRSLN